MKNIWFLRAPSLLPCVLAAALAGCGVEPWQAAGDDNPAAGAPTGLSGPARLVEVDFAGSCVSSGRFMFDPSKARDAVPPFSGVFTFTGSTPTRAIATTVGGITDNFMNAQLMAFRIKTSQGIHASHSFALRANYIKSSLPAQIDIALGTIAPVNGASLPFCDAFVGASSTAGGTFVKSVSGAAVASCTIGVTRCAMF